MKTRILLFVLMFTGVISYAQQDAQFTQYMYNTINVNPAYAGSRGALSIFALHRTQWVGLDGAPVTNAVSINTPISGSNLGLGVSLINDKIGPANENTFSADLSYTIPTSAIGSGGGHEIMVGYNFKIDMDKGRRSYRNTRFL